MRPGLVLISIVGSIVGASAARAQSACEVAVLRAPDGVRDVVARWVDNEPGCAGPLEVRIVETPGGLYVIATDGTRTFERVVPDAESAGALVASWAAVASAPPAGARVDVVVERASAVEIRVEDAGVRTEAPRRPPGARIPRTLTVGGGFAPDVGTPFVRAEVERRFGLWAVGLAGQVFEARAMETEGGGASLTSFAAWTTPPAALRLRVMAAVGFAYVDEDVIAETGVQPGGPIIDVVEASAMVTAPIGGRWDAATGLLLRKGLFLLEGGPTSLDLGDVSVLAALRRPL